MIEPFNNESQEVTISVEQNGNMELLQLYEAFDAATSITSDKQNGA